MYQTNQYEGMIAETVSMQGHKGDMINAYVARPLGSGPFPGMVVIHHAPGWDEWYRECTRRFAHHGYVAISPNLYFRDGPTMPWDTAAAHGVLCAAGGEVLDLEGAPLRYLAPRRPNPHFIALGDRALDWAPLVRAAGIS